MTHGTLTNKTTGQTLTGKKRVEGDSKLYFAIDGCRASNTFYFDDWDFTPDPEPLPTEPGFYVSDMPDYEDAVLRLTAGGWMCEGIGCSDDYVRQCLPLVRLVREDGKS